MSNNPIQWGIFTCPSSAATGVQPASGAAAPMRTIVVVKGGKRVAMRRPPLLQSLLKTVLLPDLCVMLKILSSGYHAYACGKIFSHALISNTMVSFAKGSYCLNNGGAIEKKPRAGHLCFQFINRSFQAVNCSIETPAPPQTIMSIFLLSARKSIGFRSAESDAPQAGSTMTRWLARK